MIKYLLLIASSSAVFFLNAAPQQKIAPGADIAALKIMVHQEPKELSPEMSVVVGGIYHQGMDELNIKKNPKLAEKYYKWGIDNNVTMGSFLLANLCIEHGNHKCYIENMEKVIKANDDKLSVSAAFQLTMYWNHLNRIDRSFQVMQYTADAYDDDRAQMLVGHAIISKEYVPKGWSKKDGDFYIYQACNNKNMHTEVKKQCSVLYPKSKK
jgi:lipopolysaccharide biosynthesis regulator YciM